MLKSYFSSIVSVRSTPLWEKREDPDPDLYLWPMDPDPGGLKTCGSCWSESGSPTFHALLLQFINQSRGFYFLFRNVKPAFQKLGLYGGLAYTGLFYILARGKEPWTFKHGVSPLTISLCTSVADPWHFGTNTDPRIHNNNIRIRLRIRMLLFSSATFKMATKKNIAYYFFNLHLLHFSILKS